MNNDNEDSYKRFLILEELSKDDQVTQRDISKRLGLALGLVNSYIKNLISKGYITVSTIPKKRYKYYLTPKGFMEKTALAYRHLYNFTSLYSVARKDFRRFFSDLYNNDIRRIAFCGIDEVAEIAYITLQEFEIELAGVVDHGRDGESFFGLEVRPIETLKDIDFDRVFVTSYLNGDELYSGLLDAGVPDEKIVMVGKGECEW